MTGKKLLVGCLIVVGLADTLLNGWVFLLEHEMMPLLQALVGILIRVAGIMQLRRETRATR